MSELNQRYLQLASIVGHQNWREDEVLLRAFTLWVHTQFGLAWQSVIFSAQSLPANIKGPIRKLNLTIKKGILNSIEIETEFDRYEFQVAFLRPSILVRILFLASEVNVQGIEKDGLEKILNEQVKHDQLSSSSDLYKRLMNDYVVTKRGRSRTSRLFTKLRKDPVLFFRDSKGFFGRSVYFLLHMKGQEKV